MSVGRRVLAGIGAIILTAALATPAALPATAAPDDAQFTTFSKVITPPDESPFGPTDQFSYTITLTCNSPIVDICIAAHVSDTLPAPLVFDPTVPNPVVVSGGGTPAPTVTIGDGDFDVKFNQSGTAGTGLATGQQVSITVFVQVPEDASADYDGDITNTATAAADNALPKDANAVTGLDIPESLDSTVSKTVDDHVADGQTIPALPGQPVDYTVGGGNASNRSVDEIVVQDPADGVDSPFDGYLEFTGITSITPPAGADQVQIEYLDADGNWVTTYPTGPIPTDFTNIPDVPPEDVHGLRFTFSSSTGQLPPTPADGQAAIGISSETNDEVTDIPLDGSVTVPNTASSNVVVDDRTNPPKTADGSVDISNTGPTVDTVKSFADPTLLGGDSTTATIESSNGPRPITSMTIDEPTAGQPNLADQGLVFGGFDAGVEWPPNADAVSVTYTYANGDTETIDGSTPNQIPAPTGDEAEVVGFSITFTGPIQQNAIAEIPFVVTADPVDGQLDVVSTNETTTTVTDSTGLQGEDFDTADVTRQPARVSTTVTKNIVQNEVWDLPGSTTDVSLFANVNNTGDNASTVGADSLVVSDPADPQPGDPVSPFWNAFDAKQLSAGVPANANLTVEYWDGTQWVTLPGAELIEGETTWNYTVPGDLQDDIEGIRFVYTPKPGQTLPPGFQVTPTIQVSTRDQFRDGSGSVHDAAQAADPLNIPNTASSDVTNPDDTSPDDNHATDGDEIDVNPWPEDGPGVDLVDKAWLDEDVSAFTDEQRTARISWSTQGVPFESFTITDDPSAGDDFSNIAASAYDAWDLAAIEAVDPSLDPLIVYDRIASVELYDDSADAWTDVTAQACGAVDTTGTACDGGFPRFELTDDQRASTLGVRLTYVEGSNRGAGTGPAPGSGVASSMGNGRGLDLTFQLRQEKRSDGGPVVGTLHDEPYNSGLNGVVRNTVAVHGEGPGPVDGQDADDITILDTTVNVSVSKTFDQDAMPVPPESAPQEDYPLVSATITARNETESNISALTVSDPATPPAATTDTYNTFNLYAIGTISVPADATQTIVTLDREGGGSDDYSIAEAQALDWTQLTDVIGVTVDHRDPDRVAILTTEQTSVVLTYQLREFLRDAPTVRPQMGDIVTNVASADASRPGGASTDEAHGTDDDNLQFEPAVYNVLAGKSISPASRYEDQSPNGYTVTIGGQPTGNVRTTVLTITDDEPTFWNAFEFADFPERNMPPNLDQIRVSALVGVDYAVDGGTGALVQTCAGDADLTACWEVGDWQDVSAGNTVTPALPTGVLPGDVRGIRFEVRQDENESNWENPRNPIVSFAFIADRLDDLHYGPNGEIDSYPVPSTLPGLETAPGETVQGTTTDTVDVHGSGAWEAPNGVTWEADASASDTTDLLHRPNAISVEKSPGNGQDGAAAQQFPPNAEIPYVMTVTNTGQWDMTGLELSDTVASDGDGSYLVPVPGVDPVFEFALTDSDGNALPTDGFSGSLDTASGAVTIIVPDDFVFAPGDVLVIAAHLQFRDGVAPGTPVANSITATSDRDFETCDYTHLNQPSADPATDTPTCTADTTVTPQPAAPIAMRKSVKGVEAGVPGAAPGDANFDDLGVLAVNGDADACASPNADDEYYVNNCVPITRPGGVEEWKIEFTNRGNVPADAVGGIDVLPAVGDTGVVVGSPRGSQWRPIYLGNLSVVAGPGVSGFYMTTVPNQECNAADIRYSTLGEPIPDTDPCAADVNSRDWIPFDDTTPAAELATARATKLVLDFPAGAELQPGATGSITFQTQTPATLPGAYDTDLPIAWNTVAAGSRATYQGVAYYQGPVEPVRAGVAFPVGEIDLQKSQVAPESFPFPLPDSYDFDVQCTSLGEDVDLVDESGAAVSPVEVPADGTLVEVGSGTTLPLYSDCSVEELTAQGSTVSYDPTGVNGRSGPVVARADFSDRTDIAHPFPAEPVEDATVTVTNAYEIGGFEITKEVVESGAVDQDGNPIAADPEFTFTANCDWLGADVVLPVDRDFTLHAGDDKEFAPLPVGANCTVTETDAAGASVTTVEITEDGIATDLGETDSVDFTILPDDAGGTHLTALEVTNEYTVGSLSIAKDVTGTGADTWAPDEFTVHLVCTWDQATTNPVYEDDLVIAANDTVTVDNLPTGAECAVTEPDDGGATGDPTIEPASVTIGIEGADGDPVAITVTNDFRTGGFAVEKTVAGSGIDYSADVEFTFDYVCTYEGATVDDGELSITGDGTAGPLTSESVTGLPVGSDCTITETADGGADFLPPPVVITIPDQTTAGVETIGTAPVENRFTSASIAVAKEVDGEASEIPEIADGTYTVHVVCSLTDGGTPLFDGDVEVTGGTTTTITDPATGDPLLLPVGTHCWGDEIGDGGATDASVDYDSFDNAVVVEVNDGDEPETLEITATNTFDYGELTVAKELSGNPDHADGFTFEIFVTCTFDRGDGTAPIVIYDREPVEIVGGDSATLGDIPIGSECYAEEDDRQGASDVDISATVDAPIEVTDGSDITITVTNDYPDAGFRVVKEVDDGGAVDQDGDPIAYDTVFTFTAVCTFQGGTVLDETFSLSDGTDQIYSGLPAGADCTVEETGDGGAAGTSIVLTQSGTDTSFDDSTVVQFTLQPDTDAGSVNLVTVTNAYTVGSLTIAKDVTGTGEDAWAPDEFTVHLVCTLAGADPDTVYDADLVVPADGSVTVDGLPTGADCVVTEPDDLGATGDPVIEPASVAVGVEGAAGDPITVTVTNDYRTGGFVIEKTVVGSGIGFSEDVVFAFGYVCTYEGSPVAEGDLSITGDGTAGPLTSATVAGIPVGSECVVTETGDGGADGTPPPVTITIPDQAAAGVEEIATAGFENRFTAGTVSVTKQLSGTGAGLPGMADATFTVHVTCSLTEGGTPLYDGDVLVTGGQTVPVLDPATGDPLLLPVGTHCWGEERDDAGATASRVDHDSFEDAVIVVASDSDDPEPLELTATNEYDLGDISIEKDVTGNPDHAAGYTFEILVTCTFDRGPNNPPLVIYDREPVELEADEIVTLYEIPISSECYAEEPDDQGAWTVDISATEQNPVVVGTAENITITVTNDYPDAGFRVTKTVDDGGAVDQDGTPIVYDTVFQFTAVCTFQGQTVLDETFGLSDGEFAEYDTLPAGAECTVTETDTGGATGTGMTLEQDGTSTDLGETTSAVFTLVPDDDGAYVNFLGVDNPFTVGSLQLVKQVSGTGADEWAGEFGDYTVHVVCTLEAADPDTVFDDTFTLTTDAPGNVVTIDDLPTGASCTVDETDLGGATEWTATPNPIVVGDDPADPVEVTIDNEFRTGGLNVLKEVRGPGVPTFSSGPFVFQVICTYEGQTVRSVALVVPGSEDSRGPFTSETVTGIPVGSECTVTEVDNGGADDTPPPVMVVIPDQETDGVESVVTAGMLNRFSLGLLGVQKQVDGPAADAPWVQDAVFTVQVTCQLDVEGAPTIVLTNTIEIDAGGLKALRYADGRIARLPIGTHCWGEETDPAGATSAVVDHDSYENAIVVEDSRLPEILLVTATNTFEYGQVELEKTISGSVESAEGQTFTVEVTCTLDRGPNNEPYVALDHEPVQIAGGETVVLDELPVGAECWAEETDSGGAIAVTVSATEDAPVVVGVGDPVSITVDNEFEFPAPPPPTTPMAPTGVDGAGMLRIAGLAGLLMLGGAALVLALRRRRGRGETAA
ncbi:hypothetical protein BJ978_001281 [Agromyces terreus]|uniref:DUF5979 domain-containing protein n=1 Tax=Agromyces terreus TaxID=424795 RepID=A0A9X2GWX9_9MICO|nr:DUF5979 domain-containing protein [Agromyces terreus]MCP2370605.1 hypothetical protein [Agromyces terreus]